MAICFEHCGYTLQQETKVNHHYMIFDENGKMCLHASYVGELLTEEQAREIIENYISLLKSYNVMGSEKE